jgi:hypothetical protein
LTDVTTTRSRDALAGAASAGIALGVSELIAGLVASAPSLVESLGDWVIDHVPAAVKEWAIAVFGTNDKLALLIGIALTALLIGAVVGVFARKRFAVAVAVFTGFGVLAALAAMSDPEVSLAAAALPAVLAVVAGLATLRMLYNLSEQQPGTDESRRRFLLGAGAVVGFAALAAGLGRVLLEQSKRVVAGREEVVLPAAAEALPEVPAAASFDVEGLTPILVPNEDFYRIDTALSVPRVDLQEWGIDIYGML